MRDVRAVWPAAVMTHLNRDHPRPYAIYSSDPAYNGAAWIATGSTAKEAWWNARTKALATALTM